MSDHTEYIAVLTTVSAWPAEQRASLAHVLIDSLKGRAAPDRSTPTLEELVGIAKGSGPVPTDEQVEEWIDEARTRKYGR